LLPPGVISGDEIPRRDFCAAEKGDKKHGDREKANWCSAREQHD
jgi:hypothetical protein